MVSPSATRAASTKDAEARRSEASTAAALSGVFPRTMARRPSIRMFAPMRTSSRACMKRFSKMFSVMTEVPSAWVATTMYCACMSVGKPGYSSVFMSAAQSGLSPITRMESWEWAVFTPASWSFCSTAPRWAGSQPVILTSPPVRAAAVMKVPASMRSGMMRCLVPRSRFTPFTRMVEVGDFGLTGAVLHQAFPFGKAGSHQQVFRAGDGDLVEDDLGPAQALGRSLDVAVVLGDFGPQSLQAFDVEIDGTGPDGTASGQGYAGTAATGNQRAEHERRGPHGFHQFVGGLRGCQVGGLDRSAVMGAPVAEFHLRSHGREQAAGRLDVAHLGDVFENDGLIGQQSGRHAGERRILGPADAHRPEQRRAAANDELVHRHF